MLGAIAGDILGSVHEFKPVKTKDFELFDPKSQFTDDTVMTVAVAEATMNQESYTDILQNLAHLHFWGYCPEILRKFGGYSINIFDEN